MFRVLHRKSESQAEVFLHFTFTWIFLLSYCCIFMSIMYIFLGCEISDDEAEKIFTVNDAVELLKKKLDMEE